MIGQALQLGARQLRVFAFEPCAGTRDLLTARLDAVAPAAAVVVVGAALSSRSGVGELKVLGPADGRNSLEQFDGSEQCRVEEVRLTTLDEFCRDEGLASISLLKIDAEGHDIEVLKGALDLLGRGRIRVIQFEYNHRWIVARHFLRDAFQLLEPLGYQLGKVTPMGVEFYRAWHRELETFHEANYVACVLSYAACFPRTAWWNE